MLLSRAHHPLSRAPQCPVARLRISCRASAAPHFSTNLANAFDGVVALSADVSGRSPPRFEYRVLLRDDDAREDLEQAARDFLAGCHFNPVRDADCHIHKVDQHARPHVSMPSDVGRCHAGEAVTILRRGPLQLKEEANVRAVTMPVSVVFKVGRLGGEQLSCPGGQCHLTVLSER